MPDCLCWVMMVWSASCLSECEPSLVGAAQCRACMISQLSGRPCRDLVLDCGPGMHRATPRDLQLGHLKELTRLVLKGHANPFCYYAYEHEEGSSV